ncbi:MAG: hypothetical protein IPI35_35800 [Deltaproteobacteria bacterium]|nr:hypothetical protein [Deltaproteobacteria bacterium]
MRRVTPLLLILTLGALADFSRAGPPVDLRALARGYTLQSVLGLPSAAGLAFSPDGQTLYAAGTDDALRVFDARSLTLRASWGHDGARVRQVVVSPDGQRVAVGDMQGNITQHDAATGKVITRVKGTGRPCIGLGWSPDGTKLAYAALYGPARVIEAATGRPLDDLNGPGEWFGEARFSFEANRVALIGRDGLVRVLDLRTGALLKTLSAAPGEATRLVWSGDGQRLAVEDGQGQALVWTVEGKLTQVNRAPEPMGGLLFAPDHRTLLSPAGQNRVEVWSARKDTTIAPLSAPPRWLGLPIEEEVPEASEGRYLGVPAAISPDGALLAESWTNQLRVWELATGALLSTRDTGLAEVTDVDVGPKATNVVVTTTDGRVQVYDAEGAALRAELVLPKGPARAADLSPDGRTVAIAGPDFHVRVWEPFAGGPTTTMFGHTGPVTDVLYTNDGRRVLSASSDGTVGGWDVPSRQRVAELPAQPQGVRSLGLTRDGLIVAFGATPPPSAAPATPPPTPAATPGPATPLLFTSAGAPSPQAALKLGCAGVPAVVSRDGKHLICAKEQLVKVEISTGLEVYAAAGRYTSLALSPDGQLLAAGTGGGAVSVLDPKTGALLVSLPGHAERVTAVAFSDDGRVIVSGSADGTTRVWSRP